MHYVMPFILAMVVAMAWLPLLARAASKWGILDQPNLRKVHAVPIPRIGGLAMALGVLAAALIAIDLGPQDRWFLVAAGVLVAFGALDDRYEFDYRVKFLGQLIAVGIVVFASDVEVRAITLDDRVLLPAWIALPLTMLFLVGITNAINLADGLDGLAGGTTFLCLCAVALLSSVGDSGTSTALCLAFAGAVLGFLRFNTYPATVFMGDAGSQLLGFTIGVLSIRATQSPTSQVSAAIPLVLLAIPILDTLSVMVQRMSEGRSPFSADKNHIHHKLLLLGFGHHEAVMVIYALQAALFVVAYFMRYESDLTILAFVSAFFAVIITVMQIAARSGWSVREVRGAALDSPLARMLEALQQPRRLPLISYVAIVLALALYALLIALEGFTLTSDMRSFVLVLFGLGVALLAIRRGAALIVLDKAAVYVTATVLVYLDAFVVSTNQFTRALTWIAVGVAAMATAVRMRLQKDRRFEVTPLDLIVVFMALVVPSLPGTLKLPQGGALVIAKLLILFYSIEVLVGRSESRPLWIRIALVSVLGGLALRVLPPG